MINNIKLQQPTNPSANFAQLRFSSDLTPTGQFITDLRNYFKLSKQEFALLLGVATVTIANWEKHPGILQLQSRPLASLRRIAAMTRRQTAVLLIKTRKNAK